VNTSISLTSLKKSNIFGANSTRRRSTNSSLVRRTRFQNSNTTGLSPANSRSTYLQSFSVFSKIYECLQISRKRQFNFLKHHKYLLLHKSNKRRHLLLLLHLLQHRITNKSLAQVDYNQTRINTISGPKRQLTTKSCTPESNKDVESSGVKPRPSSPNWLQGLSPQNSLLRIHLPTKDHHPNHRGPLVFSIAFFYVKFSTKTTNSYRLHLFTTRQASTSFPANGSLRGFYFHQPR